MLRVAWGKIRRCQIGTNRSHFYEKIFSDLDDDGQISEMDISNIVDRLTWSVIDDRITSNHIDRDSKLKIAKVVCIYIIFSLLAFADDFCIT